MTARMTTVLQRESMGPGLTLPDATSPAPQRSSRVARLAREAGEAAQIRALTTDPDVIAYRVEKIRGQVDGLLWAGIVLGLAFTMVNVQGFAATTAPTGSLAWWVAWLLDPMVSLVLLAVLRAEQVTARYQVTLPAWGLRTKWLTFAATYVMNTWTSWGLTDRPLSWSGIVLHSVPPLVVFATAETGPGLRDRLTEAVHRALTEYTGQDGSTGAPSVAAEPTPGVHEPVTDGAHEPTHEPVAAPPTEAVPSRPPRRPGTRRATRRGKPTPRRLLADYLTEARTALESARTAGAPVEPSPGWVRQVTGCSAGTSVKVAAALRALLPATPDPTLVSVPVDRPEAA